MTTLDKILVGNSILSLSIHIFAVMRWTKKYADKEARYFRNAIILRHVKAGHTGRLKYCPDEQCISLRRPVPHQAAPLQPVQAD